MIIDPKLNLVKEAVAAEEELADRREQELEQEALANVPAALRKTNLQSNATVDEEYDLNGMYNEGASFEEVGEGEEAEGVRLPTHNLRPGKAIVAGKDIVTDEPVATPFRDADGLINDGRTALAEGYATTAGIYRPEDLEHLTKIARGVQRENGTYDEFATGPWNDDFKRVAWNAAQQTEAQRSLVDDIAYDRYVDPEPDIPTPEIAEDLDEEQLRTHPAWLTAARSVYEYLEGEPFEGTDEELHSLAMGEMSRFSNSPSYMIWRAGRMFANDSPEEIAFAQAYSTLVLGYRGVSPFTPMTVARGVYNAFTDPLTYVGVTTPMVLMRKASVTAFQNTLLKKIAQRVAATKALSKAGTGLASRQAAARIARQGITYGGYAAGFATVGGAEAYLFGGLTEWAEQAVDIAAEKREALDYGEMHAEGARAAPYGMALGGALGTAVHPTTVKHARQVAQRVAQNAKDMTMTPAGSMQSQRGFIDFSFRLQHPSKAPGAPSPQIASRLEQALVEHQGLLRPSKRNKNPTMKASELLRRVMVQDAANKYGFSPREIEQVQLDKWLETKGDAEVSHDEVADWMYANRVRLGQYVTPDHPEMAPSPYQASTRASDTGMPLSLLNATAKQVEKNFEVKFDEVPVDLTEYSRWVDNTKREVHQFIEKQESVRAHEFAEREGQEDFFGDWERPFAPSLYAGMPYDIPGNNVNQWYQHFSDVMVRYEDNVRIGAANPADPKNLPKPPEFLTSINRQEYYITDVNGVPLHDGDGNFTKFGTESEATDFREARVAQMLPDMKQSEITTLWDINADALFAEMTANPHWETYSYVARAHGKENIENYRTLRVVMNTDMRSDQTIALEHLGKPLDSLSKEELGRVKRVKEMMPPSTDVSLAKGFTEDVHFPGEFNRLVHFRMFDAYDEQGNLVLFVEEFQSDANRAANDYGMMYDERFAPPAEKVAEAKEAMKAALKEKMPTAEDTILEDMIERLERGYTVAGWLEANTNQRANSEAGRELLAAAREYRKFVPGPRAIPRMPYVGSRAHWTEFAVTQVTEYAYRNGYNRIVLPRTDRQLQASEHWGRDAFENTTKYSGIVAMYQQMIKALGKKSQKNLFIKPQGSKQIYSESHIYLDPDKNRMVDPIAWLRKEGEMTEPSTTSISEGRYEGMTLQDVMALDEYAEARQWTADRADVSDWYPNWNPFTQEPVNLDPSELDTEYVDALLNHLGNITDPNILNRSFNEVMEEITSDTSLSSGVRRGATMISKWGVGRSEVVTVQETPAQPFAVLELNTEHLDKNPVPLAGVAVVPGGGATLYGERDEEKQLK